MDLCKLNLMFCLWLAFREAHGILWNSKQTTHIGDLGFEALQSLSDSQESALKGHLTGTEHFRPLSEKWASKTTHETTNLSPKGEIIHRDDQTLLKWTKGCDGIDHTPHELVQGFILKHDKRHIDTPQQISQNLRYIKKNITITAEKEDLLDDESVLLNDDDNNKSDGHGTSKTPADAIAEMESTEHGDITLDNKVESEPVYVPHDDTERNMNLSTNSVKESDLEEPVDMYHRFASQKSPTVSAVEIQRITKTQKDPRDFEDPHDLRTQRLFDKLGNAQWNIKSQNSYRPNLADLRETPYHFAPPEEALEQNYFAQGNDRFRFNPNNDALANQQPIEPMRHGPSHPYDAQPIYGLPSYNSFPPWQHDSEYNRYGYGTDPNLMYPSSDQSQDLFASFIANQQGFYGYDHNVPAYSMNAMANVPNSLADTYRYMQSPYADGFPSRASQIGDLRPTVYDALPAGNRRFRSN